MFLILLELLAKHFSSVSKMSLKKSVSNTREGEKELSECDLLYAFVFFRPATEIVLVFVVVLQNLSPVV